MILGCSTRVVLGSGTRVVLGCGTARHSTLALRVLCAVLLAGPGCTFQVVIRCVRQWSRRLAPLIYRLPRRLTPLASSFECWLSAKLRRAHRGVGEGVGAPAPPCGSGWWYGLLPSPSPDTNGEPRPPCGRTHGWRGVASRCGGRCTTWWRALRQAQQSAWGQKGKAGGAVPYYPSTTLVLP